MSVEFVILAPLLVVMMLFLVFAGRVVEAHSQVDGAARDAARAASIARSYGQAVLDAQAAVRADVGTMCPASGIVLAGYAAGSNDVTVTVHCTVPTSFLGFGFGNVPMTGYAIAPLDPFAARTYG